MDLSSPALKIRHRHEPKMMSIFGPCCQVGRERCQVGHEARFLRRRAVTSVVPPHSSGPRRLRGRDGCDPGTGGDSWDPRQPSAARRFADRPLLPRAKRAAGTVKSGVRVPETGGPRNVPSFRTAWSGLLFFGRVAARLSGWRDRWERRRGQHDRVRRMRTSSRKLPSSLLRPLIDAGVRIVEVWRQGGAPYDRYPH